MILAGAWFAFITVDQHVFRLGALLRHKGPLHACGKSSASTTAQVRGLHLVDDPIGTLREALPRSLISAKFDVLVDVRRAQAETLTDDFHFIVMRDEFRHAWSSLLTRLSRGSRPGLKAPDRG